MIVMINRHKGVYSLTPVRMQTNRERVDLNLNRWTFLIIDNGPLEDHRCADSAVDTHTRTKNDDAGDGRICLCVPVVCF